MLSTSKPWKSLPVVALSLFLLPPVTQAQHYKQTNLVSNLASISTPNPTDPNLKNPWGLTRSPGGSPWWLASRNHVDSHGRRLQWQPHRFPDRSRHSRNICPLHLRD